MKERLIQKAQELRQHGFTTGEIADELNVSMDTARWLTLQKAEEKTEAPVDFAINWNSIGGNSTRLSYVSGALSDMALTHGEADVVCGIAVSGVPFATVMADFIEDMSGVVTSLAIFHPNKHRKDNDSDDEGTISTNFGSVEGKKVIIVDDVITSGKTVKEVIHTVRDLGGEPTCVTVLIDKAGLSEIEEVPVESLIKVSRL
ncbi:orotate phosphoribosyltransferase-like protein [uncultured Methanobrevibacter sp.]|uniref:orotate phosphoribosyltransferase-like protein n=1 Tax=uncultured Methanobrevibacter sp. TaxID=253161 RepID=UPI002639B996|nr:orotate phosphoribosyltransferase-like protein [uncultured Methanobrevibacter sp.]